MKTQAKTHTKSQSPSQIQSEIQSQIKPKPSTQANSRLTPPNPKKSRKTDLASKHNVYDKFYKTVFSYSSLLEEFFQVFFPQLAKYVDFKKSQQIKSTFIQSDYVDREADIVYSVPIAGKSVYIYILIEHQSKPDKQIFLRLIGYQLALWNDLIRQKKATPLKLPPILPMVFYNGKKKWEIPKHFTKTFDKAPKEIMRFTPNFEYLFFDIHSTPDTILNRGNELIKLPLLLDKNREHIDQNFKTFFSRLFEKRKSQSDSKSNATNNDSLLDLVRACYYLALYHTKRPHEQLELDFDSLEKEEEFKQELIEMRKSAAHQLYEEGLEEGREKGREEGREEGQALAKVELAKKLVAENTDLAFIARITGLDMSIVSAMKKDLDK